ncbi:MAG TPA: hypothetical protein VMY05_11700 [Acidobacteriota bacterium]|nr:hypothetical protein [Acidobacteriota bacterium]
MRKLMAIGLFGAIVAAALLWFEPFNQRAPWELDRADAEFYRFKRDGKRPKLLRRPNTWFYEQRAYPYDRIPQDQYLEALDEARIARREYRAMGGDAVTWQETGPTNIPGRIASIAVHPSDPNTIYAGSAAGGVYKSTDLGGNWTAIFDDVGTFSIGAVAIHPSDPDVIYVGTGEPTAAIDDYEGTGVYKSLDGGATWNLVGLPNSALIGRIVIDPLHPDTVYVAVLGQVFGTGTSMDRGLYRSQDGGANWEKILFVDAQTGCVDVALHPSTGTVFAAMYIVYSGATSAIWKSSDHGDTFTMISGTGGLPAPGNIGRIGLSLDPQSETVYAIHVDGATQDLLGIYKSTNLGVAWTRTNDGELYGTYGGFAWYFGQIRVAPGYPDIVYSLGVSLWKSEDGGANWFNASGGTHVDHHAMCILPTNPDVVYNGCDGGVNYTNNGGYSWTTFRNMANTQFYAMTVDYNNPDHIYGGTQDNGTMRTMSGSTGDWDEIYGGDGFYCLVDYTNPNVIYVESQNGNLAKSTDGGFSFSWAQNGIDPSGTEPHGWNTPVAMDPVHPNILYYGTDRVYRTADGAENWTAISSALSSRYITTMGVARSDSQVVYAGSRVGTVHVTTNDGASWTRIDGVLPDRWVTRLTVDPYDAAVCYVTLSGYISNGSTLPHIFRTANYGSGWTDISSNLPDAPLNDVIIDPHDNQTLYVGSDVGVFVTHDLGGSWAPLGTGMPVTCVHDLEMNARTRLLVAATHGRSMFKTIIPCADETDSDGDDVPDGCDNCPSVANTDQADADGDLIGDACDDCIDSDRDGFGAPGYPLATCPLDNCPTVYNPNQTDTDGDGIGDACEFITETTFDTITTPCVSLIVANSGNFGNQGSPTLTLDYADQGDCEFAYMYDGTPVIARYTGQEYVADYFLFGKSTFNVPLDGNPTVPTVQTGEYQVYESGTFVTADLSIALEKTWYAPAQADSCPFVIQCLKVYSWDGQQHSGLAIGEAVDWDIPSASGVDNLGGFDVAARLIYQQGLGFGCQSNEARFGGQALIGIGYDDACIDTSAQPYGAYTALNSIFLYPTGGFVPEEIYTNMQQPSYSAEMTGADQHAVMTFFNNQTIGPDDTLFIYSVVTSVRNGPSTELVNNVYKARKWVNDHVRPACAPTCCIGLTGNVDGDPEETIDIGDVTALIDYLFISNTVPECMEEANTDGDGDGVVDIGDLTALIDYLFISNTEPAACP